MSAVNWNEVHDRLLLVVDTLTTCHVRDGFPRERVAADAEAALAYARRCAAGEPEDEDAFTGSITRFALRYGQSIQWVIFGDLRTMICTGAARPAWERRT